MQIKIKCPRCSNDINCYTKDDVDIVICPTCKAKLKLRDKINSSASFNYENYTANSQFDSDFKTSNTNFSSNQNFSQSSNSNNAKSAEQWVGDTVDKIEGKISGVTRKIADNRRSETKIVCDRNIEDASKFVKPLDFSSKIDTEGVTREVHKHPYSKLGGFLAFIFYGGLICEILGVVAVVVSLILMIKTIPTFPWIILYILGIIAVAGICYPLVFVWFVKIKNKSIDFLHYFIKLEIVFIIAWVILEFIDLFVSVVPFMTSVYGNTIWGQFIGTVVGWEIFSIVMTAIISALIIWLFALYFCKSVRVRMYMGTDAYAKLSVFTRNIKMAVPADDVPGFTAEGTYETCASNSSNTTFSNNSTNNNDSPKHAQNPSQQQSQSFDKFCPFCGAGLKKGHQFCTKCGKKV